MKVLYFHIVKSHLYSKTRANNFLSLFIAHHHLFILSTIVGTAVVGGRQKYKIIFAEHFPTPTQMTGKRQTKNEIVYKMCIIGVEPYYYYYPCRSLLSTHPH